MAKKETIKSDAYQIDFVPGEKGSLKMAYVRIETTNNNDIMCLDNENLKDAIKVRDWLTKIIEANK